MNDRDFEVRPFDDLQEPTDMAPDTAELLLRETQESNRLLKKQLRTTRSLAVVLAILALVLALAGLWAAATVDRTLGQMDFDQLAQSLNELDVEGLNRAVSSLEEQVRALDMEGLNEALSDLGGAANEIEKTMDAFNGFSDSLGSIFKRG